MNEYKKKENPLISVIMNCYNSSVYLKEAIDSVFAQTYTNWEIIFWDNQSTDESPKIAKSYSEKLKYLFAPTHTTLGEARKLAVEKASGDWIAFLDCDDYWLSDKLQKQVNAVIDTSYILCYGGVKEITPDGVFIREDISNYPSGSMLEKQLYQFDINMVTPIIKTEILKKYKITFNENITASEEYNLFIRLAAKGEFCVIPEVLGVYRVQTSSLTNKQISKWANERYITLEQLKSENPGIDKQYPLAFREAHARGDYYKARYLMSIGDRKSAREVMWGIRTVHILYLFLWLVLFFPFLWNLIHSSNLKRKIVTFWNGLRKRKI